MSEEPPPPQKPEDDTVITTCTATTRSTRSTRIARRTALLTVSLSFAGLLGAVPASAATTVAGSADTTDGANGRVSAIVRAGSRIFIGGSFTMVGGLPRRGLAALNADTGAVDPSWSADVAGEVLSLAVSPTGTGVYAGGAFTSVRGVPRANLAAVSASTGLVSPWNPGANSSVLAIASSSSSVIVGGKFTVVGGASLGKLAMVDATYGRPNLSFVPRPDGWVGSLQLSPTGTGIYVGGNFSRIGGQYRPRLAAVLLSNGAATSWYPDASTCPVIGAALSPDGTRLFVACAGASNSVASYNTTVNGPRVWRGMADGNVQAVALVGSTVYAGGHFARMNSVERRKVAAFDYATGALQPWAPRLNSPLGVWALCASTNGVWAGGDFTRVNYSPQQHIALFRQIG